MNGRKAQEAAAARVGVRTSRGWKDGPLPSEAKLPRHWRTRPDPFAVVWDEQVVEASIDFTHVDELGVTTQGQTFGHLLFESVLASSGRTWIEVVLGETSETLVSGLQGALWALGGMPVALRADKLSAATYELKRDAGMLAPEARLRARIVPEPSEREPPGAAGPACGPGAATSGGTPAGPVAERPFRPGRCRRPGPRFDRDRTHAARP